MQGLSIVVPFFQKQRELNQVWPLLKPQLGDDDEVLVVDDWSPDGCELSHPKVRIVRHYDRNHIFRLCTLRNLGLEEARNDAVLILDPDCKPREDLLAAARGLFDEGVLFGGRIDFEDANGVAQPDPRLKKIWPLGFQIWGGCMLFSKSRASLVGWFDERFNGRWGCEDNDFANRCFHSGMDLDYTEKLHVTHIYHGDSSRFGYQENLKLAVDRMNAYPTKFEMLTPYHPEVGVLVVTLMRPMYLWQCLRSLARVRIPLRIYLVNQADKGEETQALCSRWRSKWAVVYHENEKIEGLAAMKKMAMEEMKQAGLSYSLIMDDDVVPLPGAVETLVKQIKLHPEVHSLAGYLIERGRKKVLLGGRINRSGREVRFPRMDLKPGVTEVEWVGGGFTVHRLDPLVTHDPGYIIGLEDFDYSLQLRKLGLVGAVCGETGAFHKVFLTREGLFEMSFFERRDSHIYMRARMDSVRLGGSFALFRKKWGLDVF